MGLFHYNYYLTTSDNLKMAEISSGLKAKSRSYVLTHSNGIIVYGDAVKQWYQRRFPRLRIEVCPNIQNPQTLLAYRSQFQLSFKNTFNNMVWQGLLLFFTQVG